MMEMDKIEQAFEKIEEYIGSCKWQTFSKENIIVDRNYLEGLLGDLKRNIPKEDIERYRKVSDNSQEILKDARAKGQAIIERAKQQAKELVNENEVIQQLQARAQEVEFLANQRAQEIVDAAMKDANEVRAAAVQYTDDLLANIDTLLVHSIQTTAGQYENMLTTLNQYREVVLNNRQELRGGDDSNAVYDESLEQPSTGELDIM